MAPLDRGQVASRSLPDDRLAASSMRQRQAARQRLLALEGKLGLLSPNSTLARGYSMVRDEHGAIMTDSTRVQIGARLDITLAKGQVHAEVKGKED